MKPNSKHKAFQAVKISLNAILYGIITFLVLFSIASIKLKSTADIANVFQTGFLSVQSSSMSGDNKDSFNQGDVILVRMLDDQLRTRLAVGDIVTFYDLGIANHNSQRIVMIEYINNEVFLVTKGDHAAETEQLLHLSEALSVHVSTISNLGNTLDYLQSPAGFALFVMLPILILLLLEGAFLVRFLLVMNKEKLELRFRREVEHVNQSLETEIEAIRKEILRELELTKN